MFLCTYLSLYFSIHFLTKFLDLFLFSPHSFLCFRVLSRFVNDDVAFGKLLLFLYFSLLVILFVSTFFHFVAFVSLLSFSKHLFMLLCCCIFLVSLCLNLVFTLQCVFLLRLSTCFYVVVCFFLFNFFRFSSSLFVFHLLCKIILPQFILHFYYTSFFAHFFFCYNFYLCCTSFFAHFNFITILHLYCCQCTIFL